ncbi:unnamed protein product [Orchesella dallaii]|uniref:Uncharacterized protein n=1 Tax=Orchesella dallaii TaxID=48710 RepID=A0ABP1S4E5_9HEXA
MGVAAILSNPNAFTNLFLCQKRFQIEKIPGKTFVGTGPTQNISQFVITVTILFAYPATIPLLPLFTFINPCQQTLPAALLSLGMPQSACKGWFLRLVTYLTEVLLCGGSTMYYCYAALLLSTVIEKLRRSLSILIQRKWKPTTIFRETLMLDNEISMMFRSCSVHIVLNEIVKEKNNSFQIDSYELSPFTFPVIISKYLYVLRRDKSFEYFMRCGDYIAPIVARNQEFKFWVPPNPRMQCFAMVHIVPKACKIWTHAQLEMEYRDGLIAYEDYRVPDTILLPVFDHRIQKALAATKKPKGDRNVGVNSGPEFKVFKSGLIIIQVEMRDSDSYHDGIDYTESPLFLMEFLFERYGYSAAAPTMFLFKIGFSEIMKSYVVSKTLAMVCWENYPPDWVKRPGQKVRVDGDFIIFRERPELTVTRVFQRFLTTSNTLWQYFESLHSKCGGGVNLQTAHMLKNVYIKTGQIRKWKGDDNLFHASVIQSLCINLTAQAEMGKRYFIFASKATTDPITEAFFNTFNHAVHFITCAPTQTPGFLSILGYMSAFDIPTWLMLMISGLGSGLLLHRLMWKKQKVLKSDWYPVSFVFNVLLAQGTKYIHVDKWIGGCWILVGVVITFFYQGENINRLTAPILPKRIETFDELLRSNLTIDSSHSSMDGLRELQTMPAEYEKIIGPGHSEYLFRLFESTMSEHYGDHILFLKLYYVKNSNMTMKQVRKKLKNRITVPRTFFEFMKELDPNYNFEKVSNCGQNVLVDTLGNIQAIEGRLRLGGVDPENIVVSKTNYGVTYENWLINGVPWPSSPFTIKLHSLFHSGKTKSKPTTIFRETLMLDKEISSLFRSCSVHIVLNEIVKEDENSLQIDSYELSPFTFPVIISKYQYVLGRDRRIDYFMRCGEYTAPIEAKNQEFKFWAPPNPRMQCFAMVHIAPKACKIWTYAQYVIEYRDGLRKYQDYGVPDTILLPVFDHRIQKAVAATKKPIGDPNIRLRFGPNFKVFKSGLIIIQIEKHDSDSYRDGIDYSESALFLMEYLFEQYGYSAAAPTMFLFKIRFSEIMKSYVVSKTLAMVCWENYPPDWVKRPGRKIGVNGNFIILRERPDFTVTRVFQSFLTTPNTPWQYFETLHSKCDGGVNLQTAFMLKNVFINTGQIRNWKGDDSLFHASVIQSLSINLTAQAEMGKRFFIFGSMTSTEPITETFFNTFNHAVHFLTCAPTKTPGFLSILGYMSAFDIPTWLMLMISGLGSSLLLHRLMWKKQKVLKSDWYPVSFVFNVLLAQGTKYIHMDRWIGGCWILVGVVITFFYQGENINRLTAPILPKSIETFDELLKSNLTIDSAHSSMTLLRQLETMPAVRESFRGHSQHLYRLFEITMLEKVGDLILFLKLYYSVLS